MPTEDEIETYMRGECHIHAIAAVRIHGGHFAIAYDHSEPYFESEDGDDDVPSPLHVWSIHETADGLIARDVLGDVPATKEAMTANVLRRYPDLEGDFAFGDISIDLQCTLEEVTDLSGDEDHQPLYGIREEDIALAAEMHSVTSEPGTNPAGDEPCPSPE